MDATRTGLTLRAPSTWTAGPTWLVLLDLAFLLLPAGAAPAQEAAAGSADRSIRATSHAAGDAGDLWDVRTRNAVVKLTYLLRL